MRSLSIGTRTKIAADAGRPGWPVVSLRRCQVRTGILVAVLLLALAPGVRAQDAAAPAKPAQPGLPPSPLGMSPGGQKGGARGQGQSDPQRAAEQHRLPPDSTTKHTLALPGRTLSFTATAGSIRLFDDKGEAVADVAYTSYQLDGTDRAPRPVTFLFNGGPGASSAWLQLGDAGPWRLSITGEGAVCFRLARSAAERRDLARFHRSCLHRPVGTGYSRFVATGDEVRRSI